MFKNAEYDPLTIPARGVSRRSVGPSRRTAGFHPDDPAHANPHFDALGDEDPRYEEEMASAQPGSTGELQQIINLGPGGHPDYHRAVEQLQQRQGPANFDQFGDQMGGALGYQASVPRKVAIVLDREARSFMDVEGNTDDRSELLYRARRHASTLTSTWSREASQKATEAFCGRVAAMIPNRPRTAAAPVTEFADFDDMLLY